MQSEKPEGKILCIDRIDPALLPMHSSFTVDKSLERIFGEGATRLAIELMNKSAEQDNDKASGDNQSMLQSSTPARDTISNKRLRGEETSFGDLSIIIDHGEGSKVEVSGSDSLVEAKKQKLTDLGSAGSTLIEKREVGESAVTGGKVLAGIGESSGKKVDSRSGENVTAVDMGLHQDPDLVRQDSGEA